eukprot:2795222-Alexandrium_andersonii.AAC.1
MGRGPSAWRCRKAARRLDPQPPPATAVWHGERHGSRMGPTSVTVMAPARRGQQVGIWSGLK